MNVLSNPTSPRRLLQITTAVAGLLIAWPLAVWLDQAFAPGTGWLWLTLTVLLGGIAVHVLRRREYAACSTSAMPRVSALQVSCLAAQALGVQLFWGSGSPAFSAAFPLLALPWLPFVFIAGGVAGLGWLSLFCDCRDSALKGEG